MILPKLHQPVARKAVVLPHLRRDDAFTGVMAASQSLATAESRPVYPNAGTGMMASSLGMAEQQRKKSLPSFDLTHISSSGKGTWNQQLKTGFTDALNAGLAEGLGHFKTGFAGLGKLIAETKPQIKGTVLPALPDLAEHMDGVIQRTESWIADNTPSQMTAFQQFAKDLMSGAVSIFGSIGLGLVTGSAGLSAAVFGATQTGSKYIEERKAGLSPERAGGLSSLQGGIEGALEGIGLDTFLRLTKGVAWNTLVRAATEAVQEGSQQFGENLVDKVWNKDKPLSEGVLRSALIGGLLGIPAAVSVSAYEQSQPFTQAVREVVSLGYSESKAIAIVQKMVEDAFATASPTIETAVADFKQLPAFAETTTPIPQGGKMTSTEVIPMEGEVEPALVAPVVPKRRRAKVTLPPIDVDKVAISTAKHAAMSSPPEVVIDKTVVTPSVNGLVDITDMVDMATVQNKWKNADHVYLDPKRRTILFKAGDVSLDAMAIDTRHEKLMEWFGIDGNRILDTLKSGGKLEISNQGTSVSTSPATNVQGGAKIGVSPQKAEEVSPPAPPTSPLRVEETPQGAEETTLAQSSAVPPVKWGKWKKAGDAEYRLVNEPTQIRQWGKSDFQPPTFGKPLQFKGDTHSYYLVRESAIPAKGGFAALPASYRVVEAQSGNAVSIEATEAGAVSTAQRSLNSYGQTIDDRIAELVALHGGVANPVVTNDAPSYSMTASGTSAPIQGGVGYTTTVTATDLKDPRASVLTALTDISASLAERTNVEVGAIQQAKKLLVGFEAKETPVLQETLAKVKAVLQQGKKDFAARQHAAAQKKATLVEKITKDVQPFVKTGAAPDRAEVVKWWSSVKEAGKELDLVLSPMDRIEAAMHTAIKKQLDEDYGNYLITKRKPGEQAFKIIREHRLTPADGVAIKNYAILQQGRTDILAAMGIDPKAVKDLTRGQKVFYDFARKWYDFTYPSLEKFLKDTYNKQLGYVKNYWPLPGEGATADSRIEDRFFDREALYTHTVSMEETKQRKGKFYTSTTNAFEDFFDYVDDAAYLLACGKDIKNYYEAVNTPAFNKAAGDLGQTVWLEWLDLMARKGGTANSRRIRWLDTLRNNVGIGVMGFKLSTTLLQFTALADGMTAVHGNPAALVNGALALTDPSWRAFLSKYMPEVTEGQGNDPAIGDITKWRKWSRASFAPLIWADAAVRRTVAMAAYLQRCEELGVAADPATPNDGALEYAQRWTRVTQGSSMWKDQPLAISRGLFQLYSGDQRAVGNVSLGKTLLQFQSFMLFRWANIKDTIWTYGLKQGNLGTAASGMMWLLLIAAAAEIGTRRLSKEIIARLFGHVARQDDGFFKEMWKQQVDNVPFVGSIMNALEYDGDFIPAYAAVKDLLQYGQGIVTRDSTSAKVRSAVQFVGSLGTVAGVPGAKQVGQFVSEATYQPPAQKRSIRVPRLRPKRR